MALILGYRTIPTPTFEISRLAFQAIEWPLYSLNNYLNNLSKTTPPSHSQAYQAKLDQIISGQFALIRYQGLKYLQWAYLGGRCKDRYLPDYHTMKEIGLFVASGLLNEFFNKVIVKKPSREALLGIKRSVSGWENTMKTNYRKLAIQLHPDKNPNDLQVAKILFEVLNEARCSIETEKPSKIIYQ